MNRLSGLLGCPNLVPLLKNMERSVLLKVTEDLGSEVLTRVRNLVYGKVSDPIESQERCERISDLLQMYFKSEGRGEPICLQLDWFTRQIVPERICPQVVVSHNHEYGTVANAVVATLQTAYWLDSSDLRCTSKPSHGLRPGDRLIESLRNEILIAPVTLCLYGPQPQKSDFVDMERFGAELAHGRSYPLLIKGATAESLPETLRGRVALDLRRTGDVFELIDAVGDDLHVKLKPRILSAVSEQVERLVRLAA